MFTCGKSLSFLDKIGKILFVACSGCRKFLSIQIWCHSQVSKLSVLSKIQGVSTTNQNNEATNLVIYTPSILEQAKYMKFNCVKSVSLSTSTILKSYFIKTVLSVDSVLPPNCMATTTTL